MRGSRSGRIRGSAGLTCEELPALDIRLLTRKGLLNDGARGSLSWTQHGETTERATVVASYNRLQVVLRQVSRNDETKPISQALSIVTTLQHFSGKRSWFQCPTCGRRCALLYALDDFSCRLCHRLAYQSERENKIERLTRKLDIIGGRLETDPSLMDHFPQRPRGMHWRTYGQLLGRYQGVWEEISVCFGDPSC